MSKRRKWLYWVACAIVLLGAAAAVYWALPKKDVIPAAKFDGSERLSELSQDDCIAFINYKKISVPGELKNSDLGAFVKERIIQFETDPYSAAAYDVYEIGKFVEDIRQAVNTHYDVPTLEYGVYEFDKCLYMTPISSYYPFDGTGEIYNVSPYIFLIANQEYPDSSEKFNMLYWKVQPIDLGTWDAKFLFIHPDVIDISGYTYRACYPISERCQILLMDGEVWLAKLNSDSGVFWSIYKLKLVK